MRKWISVKDELPEFPINKNGYLCRCVIGENYDFPFYMVLKYYILDVNPHFQHECNCGLRVTHWTPLPEPPKEDKT